MEIDEKPNVNTIKCCVACLASDCKKIENADFIKIYEALVHEELTQELELCEICIAALLNIKDFQAQCLRSIRYLKNERLQFDFVSVQNEDQTFAPVPKEENFLDDIEIKEEVVDVLEDNIIIQTHGKQAVLPKVYNKISIESPPPARKRNFCNLCGEFFIQNLYRHNLTLHSMPFENDTVICNVCDSIFKNEMDTVNDHFDTHGDFPEPKPCEMCGLAFKNRQGYVVHVVSHQKEVQTKKKNNPACRFCGKVFDGANQLKYHTMEKHFGAFCCTFCRRRTFFDVDEYEKHMAMEKEKFDIQNYTCDDCGLQTKYKCTLVRHKFSVHTPPSLNPDASTFLCYECGEIFKNKGRLQAHQIAKHRKKIHQCTKCDRKYALRRDLNHHFKICHTYKDCEVCGKKMKARSIRYHMMQLHKPSVRNVKCDLCDKTFTNTSGLSRHSYSHSKTRPYNCHLCPMGYFENRLLKKHFETTHEIVYTNAEIRTICGKKNWEHYT